MWKLINFIIWWFYSVAPCVTFSQSLYRIDEDKGPVQLVLILSNPSTTDTIVTVFSNDGSATGKNNIMYIYTCKIQVM